MTDTRLETPSAGEPRPVLPASEPGSSVPRVLEILQTILTGLMLAFIFRAFCIEPFIIPTGSMANSLLGAHATTTCPACGFEYDVAPLRATSPSGSGFVAPEETECPNCQLRAALPAIGALPKSGDRLVVHKWPFALGVPLRQWEVIVFRDPAHPEQHYIKRLIGLPGQTIEIVDGDVFVNGMVAHKPPDAQSVLWLPVFDQARMPGPAAAAAKAERWRAVDPADGQAAGWTGMDSRVIRYDGLDRSPRRLAFNPDAGRDYLTDLHAYNRGSTGALVGDFRLVAEITIIDGGGRCTFEIARDRRRFQAVLSRDGQAVVCSIDEDSGHATTLGTASLQALCSGQPVALEFAHLDGQVYLEVNGRRLLTATDPDFAAGPGPLRSLRRRRPVGFVVEASELRFELRGLRIDRDVYYTQSPGTRRAYAGHPFELGDDEYFVLGDNSADSHDGREWIEGAPYLPASYRPGTVTARMIVGQAAFVYLPSLLPLDAAGRWSVPDLGRARFVR